MCVFGHVQLFATSWTVALQTPLSMGFSRQEYWSGLPFPSPGDLPNPGIKPQSPALQTGALPSEPPGKPWWLANLANQPTTNHRQIRKLSQDHSSQVPISQSMNMHKINVTEVLQLLQQCYDDILKYY